MVGCFRVLLGQNRFRLVWLINFFNRAETRLKRLKKQELENGCKSVLLGNLNRFNLTRLRLKRLIPIEHDLIVVHSISSCISFK